VPINNCINFRFIGVINIGPIFILGCHKSGTSLLRSLLDGHKDLFVIPIESHFFQNCKLSVDYRFRQSFPQRLSVVELKNNLISWIVYSNKANNDPYADSITANKWNIDRFAAYLINSSVTNWKQLFNAYVEAIYYSLYGKYFDSQNLRFVEKSVENAEFAWILRGIYPKCKFLHIVRNPYATLVAIRKHKTFNGNYPFLGHALMSMRNSYYHLYKNKNFLPDYFVIRYEDLIDQPVESMSKIANFLEIEYDDILCQPTQFGNNWSGNSTSGKNFLGISSDPLHIWKNEIMDFEVQAVNKLFPFILNDYDYKKITPSNSNFTPMNGESKEIFIRNRMLLDML